MARSAAKPRQKARTEGGQHPQPKATNVAQVEALQKEVIARAAALARAYPDYPRYAAIARTAEINPPQDLPACEWWLAVLGGWEAFIGEVGPGIVEALEKQANPALWRQLNFHLVSPETMQDIEVPGALFAPDREDEPPETLNLSETNVDDAAIDLNAAADELGLSKRRAFEAMKREAAETARETTDRAKAEPRLTTELLSTVYPAEDVGKALEDLAAKATRETTDRAKAEPRPDWIEAHKQGEALPDFIQRAFARELADDAMHKGLFSRYENLRRDLYAYRRHNELPDWLKAIPTQSEWNDRQVAVGKVKPVRPPARTVDEVRAYERDLKRVTRAQQRGVAPV